MAVICYVIPFLNFNLFFTNWIFFALILWIINSKNINILKMGLIFGTSTVLIGEYWIPGTIKNLSGVNTALSLFIHILYAIYESLFFVVIFLFTKRILSLRKRFHINKVFNYNTFLYNRRGVLSKNIPIYFGKHPNPL